MPAEVKLRITISDRLVNHRCAERSAIALTARFFDDSADPWSASTPTSVKYRIDNADTACSILDWTTATAASSVTLAITSAQNAIVDSCKAEERHQVTVKADDGLATQYQATHDYWVTNLVGQT